MDTYFFLKESRWDFKKSKEHRGRNECIYIGDNTNSLGRIIIDRKLSILEKIYTLDGENGAKQNSTTGKESKAGMSKCLCWQYTVGLKNSEKLNLTGNGR